MKYYLIFCFTLLSLVLYFLKGDRVPLSIERSENTIQVQETSKSQISKSKTPSHQAQVKKRQYFLSEWQDLRKKILKSPEEKERMETLYTDRSYIRRATLVLSDLNAKNLFETSDTKRIDSVNFLIEALKVTDNPEREYLHQAIKYFVLSQKFRKKLSKNDQKWVIGDKVLLLQAAYLYAPEVIQEIENHYLTKKSEAVLKMAYHRAKQHRERFVEGGSQ